jgi:hypothetical protein
VVILGVLLEVTFQMFVLGSQQGNLHFGGTGVVGATSVVGNDLSFDLSI